MRKTSGIIFFLALCLWLCSACHDEETIQDTDIEVIPKPDPDPAPEPEDSVEWISDADFRTAEGHVFLLDITNRNHEDENTERNLYSAEYILEVAGLPYTSTDKLEEALAENGMILLSSPVSDGVFSSNEVEQLTDWINNGGTLVASAVACTDAAVQAMFGISGSIRNKLRYELNFVDGRSELVYMDEPEEKTVELGSVKEGSVFTYGYTLTSGQALAYFDTGEAGLVYNQLGKGSVYTFGIKWRDVIQRSQLNKDFGASRTYSNAFEPSADSYPLVVRGIHAYRNAVSVWKHTIPDGYESVLIPTHDCDSRTAYEAMHYMSDYEKSLNLSGHYFLTVHYYRDQNYLSAFYDQTSIDASKLLLENGHTVGSHSIGHFPDFNVTNRFPLTVVTKEEYSQTADHDETTGITSGGSTWAEVVLSKQIIEEDLGNEVRSFRSGHLCMNKNIPDALKMGGYSFSSCYSAGDVLTNFPFRERLGNEWTGSFNGVLQMPLHISDVFNSDKMDESNWMNKPLIWLDTLDKLAGNYSACVLLIHPNRKWKMESQKMLVEMIDRSSIGLENFEAYGEFWNSRRDVEFEYCYIPEKSKVIIRSDRLTINTNPRLSFGIDIQQGKEVGEVVLVDEQGAGIRLRIKHLSESRILAFQP